MGWVGTDQVSLCLFVLVPSTSGSSSFIHEASGKVVFGLHWGGVGNRSVVQLLSQIHISPNYFENSFNFIREAASKLEELS